MKGNEFRIATLCQEEEMSRMSAKRRLFTSESVTEGHPDKNL